MPIVLGQCVWTRLACECVSPSTPIVKYLGLNVIVDFVLSSREHTVAFAVSVLSSFSRSCLSLSFFFTLGNC